MTIGIIQAIRTRLTPLILSALVYMALSWVNVVNAGTITVTSTADDGPGSLRQALVVALDGDTIRVTAKGTIVLTGGELVVGKSVTIRGTGAAKLSVSGNGTSRVFYILPGVTVNINDIMIMSGSANGTGFPANAGGGIFSDHAQLTLSNCIVAGNTAARFGGGIFSNSRDGGSAVLIVNNTTIANNSARYGGGIFSGGGALGLNPSGTAILTINNSTLSGNSASFGAFNPHGYGGGIFNDGFLGDATATLNNSSLSNNSAGVTDYRSEGFGGGIYNNGDSGIARLRLTWSTLNANSSGLGGGIVNDSAASVGPGEASATFIDTSVTGNTGGGISSFGPGALVSVSNSEISRNFGNGVENSANSNLFLTNSEIRENHGRTGGGIHNVADATATLKNTIVSDNIADYGGGGIYNNDAVTVLNNSTVKNNSVINGGGGIENFCTLRGATSTVTVRDSTVNNNTGSPGGGIFNYGADGCSVITTMLNSTLSNNSGIGIYTSGVGDGSSGLLILQNTTLSGNSVQPGGGAGGIQNISLYNGSATVEIANTIINADGSSENLGSNGTFVSHGFNLSSDAAGGDGGSGPGGLLNGPGDIRNTNPLLGPLKNNGGSTETHALLLGSPAIDAGQPDFNLNIFTPPLLYDQRSGPGFVRIFNGRIDIGAFESKHL